MQDLNTVEGQPLTFQYNSANNQPVKIFWGINLFDFLQVMMGSLAPVIIGKFLSMITHLPVVGLFSLLTVLSFIFGIVLLKYANKNEYPSFLSSMIGYHFLQKKKITFLSSKLPFDKRGEKTKTK